MSELQTAITNLQLKHSELVAAVKSYPGTVAGVANAAVGEASVEQRKIRDTARNLRNQIENDGQSLILDWEHDVAVVNGEGKPINEVVTFGRSTGGGRFGPDGKYEWLEAGVPRIDYDPETGGCLGLLVEEQRTNLALHSVEVTTQYYGYFRIAPRVEAIQTPVSSTASYIESDGSATSAGQVSYFRCKVSIPGAVTVSFIAKAGGANYAFISYGASLASSAVFDLTTGEITTGAGMAESNPRMIASGGGWYRCIATVPETADYQYIGVSATEAPVSYPADAGGIYITGIQFEVGSFPTSYIPTEGSSVTRAADLVYPRPLLSLQNPWAFVFRGIPQAPPGGGGATLGFHSGADRVGLFDKSLRFILRLEGSNLITATSSVTLGEAGAVAFSLEGGSFTWATSKGRSGELLLTASQRAALLSLVGGALFIARGGVTHASAVDAFPRSGSTTELLELIQ